MLRARGRSDLASPNSGSSGNAYWRQLPHRRVTAAVLNWTGCSGSRSRRQITEPESKRTPVTAAASLRLSTRHRRFARMTPKPPPGDARSAVSCPGG